MLEVVVFGKDGQRSQELFVVDGFAFEGGGDLEDFQLGRFVDGKSESQRVVAVFAEAFLDVVSFVVVAQGQQTALRSIDEMSGIAGQLFESSHKFEVVVQLPRFGHVLNILSEDSMTVANEQRHQISEPILNNRQRFGLMRFTRLQIIPNIPREINCSLLLALLYDRSSHNAAANQKLSLQCVILQQILIIQELIEEWSENSTRSLPNDELPIVPLQQRVSLLQILLSALHNNRTQRIGFLIDLAKFVMISGERIERTQLEITGADLLSSITSESADIAAYHLNAPHSEHEVAGDGQPEEGEIGVVIASPVETISIGSHGSAASDDKRHGFLPQELVGVVGVHQTEERMHISLKIIAKMR